jgi:proteic killer suppression protein
MIKSFRHKGLRRLFETGESRGVPAKFVRRIGMLLDAIDASGHPLDLQKPGFNLHQLKGDRKGTWAITVTGNLRITCGYMADDAYDVDLEDYH